MDVDDVDNETLIRVLYRALLNRDPDPQGFVHCVEMLNTENRTLHEIAADFLHSVEFFEKQRDMGYELMSLTDQRLYSGYKLADLDVFREFSHANPQPRSGFLTEFVGSRARISSLWDGCRIFDGKVLPLPIPCDYHADVVEWIGMLKAVRAATGSFAVMEVGAGHGPWTAASAVAARLRGIDELHLCAVEGDPGRFAFLQQNIDDNDLTGHDVTLIAAAVGGADGAARWPRVSDPRNVAGARPLREGNHDDEAYLRNLAQDTIDVEVVSLSRLLMARPIWDFLHIDVQGTEAELCASSVETLSERVRYLVIGTHSRKLDGDVMECLLGSGWQLEHEKPARMHCASAASLITLTIADGTQVWRNRRL